MTSADFLLLRRRQPFVPFRVVTTDGTCYEVRQPGLLMVGLESVLIGYPASGQPGVYEHVDIVSLRHVVRLEHEEGPSPSG
jgi:hypothetical protein